MAPTLSLTLTLTSSVVSESHYGSSTPTSSMLFSVEEVEEKVWSQEVEEAPVEDEDADLMQELYGAMNPHPDPDPNPNPNLKPDPDPNPNPNPDPNPNPNPNPDPNLNPNPNPNPNRLTGEGVDLVDEDGLSKARLARVSSRSRTAWDPVCSSGVRGLCGIRP